MSIDFFFSLIPCETFVCLNTGNKNTIQQHFVDPVKIFIAIILQFFITLYLFMFILFNSYKPHISLVQRDYYSKCLNSIVIIFSRHNFAMHASSVCHIEQRNNVSLIHVGLVLTKVNASWSFSTSGDLGYPLRTWFSNVTTFWPADWPRVKIKQSPSVGWASQQRAAAFMVIGLRNSVALWWRVASSTMWPTDMANHCQSSTSSNLQID